MLENNLPDTSGSILDEIESIFTEDVDVVPSQLPSFAELLKQNLVTMELIAAIIEKADDDLRSFLTAKDQE